MFCVRPVVLRLFAVVVSVFCVVVVMPAQESVSIHDIMTGLPASPELGHIVITDQGVPIVVGVVPGTVAGSNGGFYLTLQTWDSFPSTSEGIFVAGSSIPGCQVSVGQVVHVTGVVTNSTAPNLTAANTPGTYLVPSACTASGTAAMSQSISLSQVLTTFAGALQYTGMAVSDASFYAVQPTTGTVSSSTATSVTSTGQFWATLGSNTSTNNHLFRSEGIAGDEYEPASAPAGVPTWGGNPQRVLIDTTTFGGNPVDITVGQTLTCTNSGATVGATTGIGVVDYTLGYARILIFKTVTCAVSGTVATSVSAVADTTHFKVGTLDVNTFLGSASLFPTALAKATLTVTNVFGSPDIFALQQVGNQATLQYLADAANAANGGSTAYVAMVPAQDTATNLVHSGVLVNTQTLINAVAVEVGAGETYSTTQGGTAALWDQPPVVLTGEFARVGKNYPVTVIDVDFLPRDNSGDATLGPDIRAHRAAQAASVSQSVHQYQLANANVIVAGNFNSYEYNDGYVDVLGVVKGSPAAASAVTTYQATSTTAALTDFTTSVAATTRYNAIERGNAASIEHILASSTVTDATTAAAALATYVNTVTQPHFSTDYAAVDANDATTPAGLTPHDGFLVNFAIPPVPTTATLTPTALSFGDVEANGGTSTMHLTFTNTTSFASTINVSKIAFSGTNASEFTETGNCAAVGQNATCTINVMFAPLAVGTRTATLTVTSDSTSNPTLTASLTGNGIDTTASLTPSTYAFPNTSVTDTSAVKLFTFTNMAKTVSLTVGTPTVTGDYAIASDTCAAAIAPAGTCVVGVVFKPTVAGTSAGTLTVPNSSSGTPTLTAALTGVGVATTASLTPTTATFASTYAGGGVSAAQTFTFTNTSPIGLSFKTAVVTANFNLVSNSCPAAVAAGASCTLSVTFVPTVAGALSGTLTVTNGSSANGTLTAALNGTGLPTTATLTPATQAFGNVVLGTSSAAFPFVYTNTSAIALTVTAASATGDYKVSTNGCATVAAGASCTIGVVLMPTVLGTRTGTLTVASSASANPTLTSALSGRGVADVEANAALLDFGTIDVGAHSAAQVVTLTNNTTAGISLTGIALAGDYAFTTTCGATLPGLSSCMVTIVFTPTVVGTRPGTLTVTTNDTKYPVLTVALTGSGADFSLAVLPANGSMIAGNGTVTAAVTATALGGFSAPVTLTCTFQAVASTCTLPNPAFTLSGTTTQEMAVTTTGQYTLVGYGVSGALRAWAVGLGVLVVGSALLLWDGRRRFRLATRLLLGVLALMAVAGGLTGCSGKYPDLNSPYTEPGTYLYTVTATDGTIAHTAAYTLVVRQRN